VIRWCWFAVLLSGCLVNGGSTTVLQGTVDQSLLCGAPQSPDGCPVCSTPEGGLCRDQWYSSGLRCSGDAQCGGTVGACQQGFCVTTDQDADGVDDSLEREVAELNFPKVLQATDESCGAPRGVLYRVRRHPANPGRLVITYVILYGFDCGELNGHVGDAESFAITVDLGAQPGAAATVGVETVAHAGTVCNSTSSCATAAGTGKCGESAAQSSPAEVVIYTSANKHGNYLSASTCDNNCFDSCSTGQRITGPLLNVGEPGHPLVTDLTAQGFVQAPYGWPKELLNFNPWGTAEFSGGGRVDKPLTDLTAPPGE